jgi:ethanolamine utilization protein EutN
MLIARVVGDLVATQKHRSHEGRKLLMVQPLNLDGTERGNAVVALDSVDAGVGDRVLLTLEGYSAMTSVGRPESPIDMAVVGVIDRLDFFDLTAIPGALAPAPPPGSMGSGGGETIAPRHAIEQKPARKDKPGE